MHQPHRTISRGKAQAPHFANDAHFQNVLTDVYFQIGLNAHLKHFLKGRVGKFEKPARDR